MGALVPKPLLSLRGDSTAPSRASTATRSRRSNISAHYDLSNDLFAAFLDPSMSYSALFDPRRPLAEQDLHEGPAAQGRILDAASGARRQRVLEIGTAGEQFAIMAARRGAMGHHRHALGGAA